MTGLYGVAGMCGAGLLDIPQTSRTSFYDADNCGINQEQNHLVFDAQIRGRSLMGKPKEFVRFDNSVVVMRMESFRNHDGPCYIYALVGPKDGLVRYVGKTNNPDARWREHVMIGSHNALVSEWASQDGASLRILQRCADHQWQDAEQRWISFFRSRGRLYNRTGGGLSAKHRVKDYIAMTEGWKGARRSLPNKLLAASARQMARR